MMRRLTKSLLRLPLALSMFGAGRVRDVANLPEGWEDLSSSLDAVSAAADDEMDELARTFYEAGERLQGGLVDAFFAFGTAAWTDPRPAVRKAWKEISRPWSARGEETGESR